jgi:glycosyltransferase involved in cell wall biosynthesis
VQQRVACRPRLSNARHVLLDRIPSILRSALPSQASRVVTRNRAAAIPYTFKPFIRRTISDGSRCRQAPIPMRLLLIIPHIASFKTFLLDLSTVLFSRGVEVHCACSTADAWPSNGNITDNLPVHIHSIPFARGMNLVQHFNTSRQLNTLVSTIRPDLVHAHFSAAIFTTALAHRHHWPTTIGTFHGVNFLLSTGLRARLLKAAEAWASNKLDHIWVLSDDDLVGLSPFVPAAKVKKYLSYGFGCNLSTFDPATISADERRLLRSQLGVATDETVFAFVGRFVRFKGFDLTVQAFLKLAATDANARLLLIGCRDQLHPTGLTPTEEAAVRCSSQVIDLGWRSDVQRYLAITDVLVFPSSREGMPVCLMESLAMGVPVVTRNSRGCRNVVRDQTDGLVLRDCSTDSIAMAMRRLAANTELRRDLSLQALAGRERFSHLNYIREQVQTYEQLVPSSAN